MKKFMKLMSLLMVVVMLLTCFTACGGDKKSGKVTIIVPDLILNPIGIDAYTAQLQDEFDELYGDEIEVKHILATTSSDVNDVQNISTVLLGNDAPAYVGVSSTVYMKDLYNMGLIRDITDFVKDDETFNNSMENTIEACKYSDGKIIELKNETISFLGLGIPSETVAIKTFLNLSFENSQLTFFHISSNTIATFESLVSSSNDFGLIASFRK